MVQNEENETSVDGLNVENGDTAEQKNGPGKNPLGSLAITLLMIYLIAFTVILIYSLVILWPSGSQVTIFNYDLSIETRLLLAIATAGALGGLVHNLRSFYWYVGNRGLVWSWVSMYILLPFVGATIGLVFYLVIRAGFFSPQATSNEMSPFGFMALAALSGLFSEQAVLKLKDVATTLLKEADKGSDQIEKPPN